MSHANLFSSLCAIIIVIYRLATLNPVTKVEILGTSIAILGCILTSIDSKADKVDPSSSNIELGNLLAFMSSIFATLYIVKGLEVSRKLVPLHYLIILTLITTLIFLGFVPLVARNSFYYNTDPENGLFGWITDTNFMYSFFVISLINGCGTLFL